MFFKSLLASEPVSGVNSMLVASFVHVLIVLSHLFFFLMTVFEKAVLFYQRFLASALLFFLVDL